MHVIDNVAWTAAGNSVRLTYVEHYMTVEATPTPAVKASPFAGLDTSVLADVDKLAPPKTYDPFIEAAAKAAFDAGTPKRFAHPDAAVVRRFATELRQYVGERLRGPQGAIPVLRWRPQPPAEVNGQTVHAGHFTITIPKAAVPAVPAPKV